MTKIKTRVIHNNFMELTPLSEAQSVKIGELLDRAVANKENAHPKDLRRAAVVLYSAMQQGYSIVDSDVHEILDRSGGYSVTTREKLGRMANAYDDLIHGLNESENDYYKFKA
jgi:hypothetical protein